MDDDDWMDPSWTEEVEVTDVPNMDFADPRSISSCAVKLTFKKENDNKVKVDKVGSGFFINIPDTGNQYVIFTAAHNLASRDGTRTTDLVVVYTDLDSKVQKHSVNPADIYVSQDYPLKGTPETDYGFIRMPSDPSVPRRGFRFSIKLAYEDHFQGRANVIGFQDKSEDGQPVQSSGEFLGCYSKRVEYSAKTQGGISGSAVYTEYKNEPVVVAIHNNSAAGKGSGNRGARLSPEVFVNAFKWLGPNVIQENKQLAGNKPSEFFLSFQGTLDFARARLNSGTKFDIMPAEVIQDDRYALRIAGDNQWVLFSTVKNELVKTNDMKDKCLFFKDSSKKKGMRIVIKGPPEVKDGDLQLRIEGKYLKAYDEDAESSEISFVKYGIENDRTYTMFRLV